MSERCSLCGAALSPGEDCRDRFDACLALEYENPATFGAVHHLTVICYMLQHNAYSRDAWLEARRMLDRFVREEVSPEEMRELNRSKLERGKRSGSITRGAKLSEFDSIVWTRTIADLRLGDHRAYCASVKLWAESILEAPISNLAHG